MTQEYVTHFVEWSVTSEASDPLRCGRAAGAMTGCVHDMMGAILEEGDERQVPRSGTSCMLFIAGFCTRAEDICPITDLCHWKCVPG